MKNQPRSRAMSGNLTPALRSRPKANALRLHSACLHVAHRFHSENDRGEWENHDAQEWRIKIHGSSAELT